MVQHLGVDGQRCDDALVSSISLLRALGRDDEVVHVAIAELEFVRSFLPTVTPAEVAKLTERLRNHIECQEGAGGVWWETPDVCEEAATALEAQAAELARWKEAFVEQAKMLKTSTDAGLETLTSLDAERAAHAETKRALEPIKKLADAVFYVDEDGREMNASKPDDASIWGFDNAMLTYGHLRAARRVCEGGKADG